MTETGARQKRKEIIDENLRRVYEETTQEPVPDRFHLLLAALKEQESGKDTCK